MIALWGFWPGCPIRSSHKTRISVSSGFGVQIISLKQKAGRGAVGKTPIASVIDRPTNLIHTEVVESTDKATL